MAIPHFAINIGTRQFQDIQIVSEISDAEHQSLVDHLDALGNQLVDPESLIDEFGKFLSNARARAFYTLSLGLTTLGRHRDASAEEIISGVERGLERAQPDWLKDNAERWGVLKSRLHQILESEVIYIASKALDLSTEYGAIFENAWIVSDVRPVFRRDYEDVAGSILSTILTIDYSERGERKNISLLVSADDLASISQEVEKARGKIDVLRRILNASSLGALYIPEDTGKLGGDDRHE
jgi:hypothetical protein